MQHRIDKPIGPGRALLRMLLPISGLLLALPAGAVDWDAVEPHEIRLFHPGQASFEWALDPGSHDPHAVRRFRQDGRNCAQCHEGEQAELGESILANEDLEPHRFDGRPGHIDLDVQATHDGERLYMRFAWNRGGGAGEPMDPDHAARVTSLFGDNSIREVTRAGCWAACHDDLRGMASDTEDLDLTKYFMGSRTGMARTGGGEDYRDEAELEAMLEQGMFAQYWGAEITPDGAAKPRSGYIVEARHGHDDPDVDVTADRDGDRYVVEVSRPLAGDATRKALESGGVYHGGFAVHDDHTKGRFHHISLEYTLSIDSDEGDIAVMKH